MKTETRRGAEVKLSAAPQVQMIGRMIAPLAQMMSPCRPKFKFLRFQMTVNTLTDNTIPKAEQEAMAHLFAGAFGLYRNSTAHRYVPTKPEEAAEVIMFASQLLRLVDRLNRNLQEVQIHDA
jgi:hypothetical protein